MPTGEGDEWYEVVDCPHCEEYRMWWQHCITGGWHDLERHPRVSSSP